MLLADNTDLSIWATIGYFLLGSLGPMLLILTIIGLFKLIEKVDNW